MFIHKNKLFKLLVSYSIAAMGLNLFFVLAGNIHFDCNVLLFTSLLWGLEAAETAVVLFLFIVTANCLAIINIKFIVTAIIFNGCSSICYTTFYRIEGSMNYYSRQQVYSCSNTRTVTIFIPSLGLILSQYYNRYPAIIIHTSFIYEPCWVTYEIEYANEMELLNIVTVRCTSRWKY